MPREIRLSLMPEEALDDACIRKCIADATGTNPTDIHGFRRIKQSIDARSRNPVVNITLEVYINEIFAPRKPYPFEWADVHHSRFRVLIIGSGPAGLFGALRLIEKGIQPIIIERGKDVRARRRDLARMNKEGLVDPDSNYCFGEGGAGTYSDGKLYTRSNKRGNLKRIL